MALSAVVPWAWIVIGVGYASLGVDLSECDSYHVAEALLASISACGQVVTPWPYGVSTVSRLYAADSIQWI